MYPLSALKDTLKVLQKVPSVYPKGPAKVPQKYPSTIPQGTLEVS